MGELGVAAGVGGAVIGALLAWLRERSESGKRQREADDALYASQQRLIESHEARTQRAEAAAREAAASLAEWRQRCDEEIAAAVAGAAAAMRRQ